MEWLVEMEALSRRLTRALAASLGLAADGLDGAFEAPHVQAKLVHYPPGGAPGAQGLGCGAHCDSGFLTLLLQDEVGGLEVLSGDGRWVPAPPAPRALVCNLGEVLQLLSGGRYRATVHRVLQPPPGRRRLSAPFFWNPALDTVVEPLAGQVKIGLSDVGRPNATTNHLNPSYGMNAFKSLARSHPEVFKKHHPDLKCLPNGSVVSL